MPIGLAYIAGQLCLGGAEQQLYYLLAGIDRSRFRPIVISLGPVSNEYWHTPITKLGIGITHVSKRVGHAGRTLQIAEILRRENIHIVHGWVFHTNPYCAISGRLARVPLRLGSMREDCSSLPKGKCLNWFGFYGPDVLITNSKQNAKQVTKLGLTSRYVRTVPNGVPIPPPVTRLQHYELRCQLGYSDSELVVGSIGRLDENKNHVMLLRAFASLATKWPTLRLVIIGEGPLKSQLLVMAQELGVGSKVNFLGSVPRAAAFLPAFDVGCLTSRTEGMSNFIMEAAAAGIPLVSTRSGDSADLIEDSVTGFLVSPKDETHMVESLNFLLANPEDRFRMGQAGREKMRREFSIESMIARMSEIYEDALATKGIG